MNQPKLSLILHQLCCPVSRASLTVRFTVKSGDPPGAGKIWEVRSRKGTESGLPSPSKRDKTPPGRMLDLVPSWLLHEYTLKKAQEGHGMQPQHLPWKQKWCESILRCTIIRVYIWGSFMSKEKGTQFYLLILVQGRFSPNFNCAC